MNQYVYMLSEQIPWGVRREYVVRIPMRVVDLAIFRNNRKNVVPVSVLWRAR